MDLAYLLRRAAAAYPSAPAVDDGAGAVPLREVVHRGERLANALDALGVAPGAPVGVVSGNRAEYVEVDVGLALARRVRVALNARQHRDDFRFMLGDAGARVLIHSAEFAADAAALREELGLLTISLDRDDSGSRDYRALLASASPETVHRPAGEEDPAWITYTSGTTGRPKGIVLSHRSIREVAYNLLVETGPYRPGGVMVLTQPLSHGAGYFVLPNLISGGGVYLVRRFDADEVQAVGRRPEVTALKVVPAMIPRLLETQGDFGYSTIVYGASPIPAPVLDAALERFGPVLIQIYGQSEAPATITCLGKEDHARAGDHRFSAGRAFRTVAVEVRSPDGELLPAGSVGEVTVRGKHMMTGYHGLPEETAAVLRGGWVWTKDMGHLDGEGFVHLLGRSDEMIISGGFNISPREVERVILDLAPVQECAVFGIADPRWGTTVAAAVTVADGGVTPAQVIDAVKTRLGYRAPRVVAILDSIPRNPYGKVDRTELLRAFSSVQR